MSHWLLSLVFLALCTHQLFSSPLSLVRPSIGTQGFGFGHGALPLSSAQPPFSFSRPSPQTAPMPPTPYFQHQHFGGYNYPDTMIRCFQMVSMVGAGVADLGVVGLMALTTKSSKLEERHVITDGAKAFFSHKDERMDVGQYAIERMKGVLPDSGEIGVRIASGGFSAVFEWDFVGKREGTHQNAFVLLDAARTLTGDDCRTASVNLVMESDGKLFQEMNGHIQVAGSLSGRGYYQKHFGGGITVYYVLRTAQPTPVQAYGVWDSKGPHYSRTQMSGCPSGGFLQLNDSKVTVYVGISLISVDEARNNLMREMAQHDKGAVTFLTVPQTAQRTQTTWNTMLNRIQVSGGTEENRIKFYSTLHHALLSPTQYTELSGQYMGFDAQPHTMSTNQSSFYSDLSIWDVHRTQMPLLAFVYPEVHRDVAQSLLRMYEQSGCLPKWSLAYGDADCMIGQHASVILSDAILKRTLPEAQWVTAYNAMKNMATKPCAMGGRTEMDFYWSNGYIPNDRDKHAACLTVEFAYDDGCIAIVAERLGFSEDAVRFRNASRFYKNVFEPKSKFFCPKSKSGMFDCPSNHLNIFDERYIEGDAWHYRFFAPQDPEGLIALFDSREQFAAELETFMSNAQWDQWTGLPNPYYWSGNEHDLASPFFFAFIDGWKYAPQMQQHVRWLLDYMYTTDANGLSGNDDYGTLSSWFVWSSMGLYPFAGTTRYVVIAPLFEKIRVQTSADGHCALEIVAHNFGTHNIYVQKAVLNGVQLKAPVVEHDQLVARCESTLEFWMTSKEPVF